MSGKLITTKQASSSTRAPLEATHAEGFCVLPPVPSPRFFSQGWGWKRCSRVPVLLVCSPLVPARSFHPAAGGTSWDTGLFYSFSQVLQMGLTWTFPRESTHFWRGAVLTLGINHLFCKAVAKVPAAPPFCKPSCPQQAAEILFSRCQ